MRIWLMAARPRTLPAAVAPVLVGTALAMTVVDLRVGGFVAALLVDAGVRVVGFEAGGWRHRGDDHPDEHNAAYYCRGDMVPKYLAEAPAGAATTTSPRGRSRSASAG